MHTDRAALVSDEVPFGGKERKLTLGEYPAVSQAEARERWGAARVLLADNKDLMNRCFAMQSRTASWK